MCCSFPDCWRIFDRRPQGGSARAHHRSADRRTHRHASLGRPVGWLARGYLQASKLGGDTRRGRNRTNPANSRDPQLASAYFEGSSRLSPWDRITGTLGTARGSAHFFNRQFRMMQQQFCSHHGKRLPSFPVTCRSIAARLTHMGRADEARGVLRRLLSSPLSWSRPSSPVGTRRHEGSSYRVCARRLARPAGGRRGGARPRYHRADTRAIFAALARR